MDLMNSDDDVHFARPGSTNYKREVSFAVLHMSHVESNADVGTKISVSCITSAVLGGNQNDNAEELTVTVYQVGDLHE